MKTPDFAGKPCTIADPELFVPISETGPALKDIEAAKRICRGCSILKECLDWATETNQPDAIYGGMTESERDIERDKQNREANAELEVLVEEAEADRILAEV